jgi:Prokaryotic glutathione synthetase, ATP-grasp domain
MVTCAAPPEPDPDTPLLAAALEARGLAVDIADWRDATVDWASAPVTLLRSPWDYVAHLEQFLEWTQHVATVSGLWNPLDVVHWNTHKSYLLALSAGGAPIVPTVLLPQGSAAALDGIADAQGWNTIVVKPAVGIGAQGAERFEVGADDGQQHLDALLMKGDVLVQQFVESVISDGEISVVLFDGTVAHAIRKRPAPGDFRVQARYGGRVEPVEPSASLVELAARVTGLLPSPPLYARIDVVQIRGRWHVIEVEATEPSLFLETAPGSAREQLVDAIIARIRGGALYDPLRP